MEHELKVLKTEFAEHKVKQEADCKKEINSLKELICDLRGDVGEIMSMHDGQEEDLHSCLDRVRNVFKIPLFSPNFSYLS